MAILNHSQVYSFRHYERVREGDITSNDYKYNKQMLIEVKEMFLAAGWTLLGSFAGNGTVSNDGTKAGPVAGTDNWGTDSAVDYTNINRSPTGNPVWVTLQAPASMGNLQIVFASDSTAAGNDELNEWTMRASASGSFMASGGGGDGTSSALPTAPDQVTVRANSQMWTPNGNDEWTEMHACWSADQSQFFLFTTIGYAQNGFMAFSKLNNPDANLDDDMAYCFLSANSGTLSPLSVSASEMDNEAFTSQQWYGSVSGVSRTFFLGGPGWNNANLSTNIRMQDDGKADVGRSDLYSNTLGDAGFFGTVPDLYWIPQQNFFTYYADAVNDPPKWFCGGSQIIPWDVTRKAVRNF